MNEEAPLTGHSTASPTKRKAEILSAVAAELYCRAEQSFSRMSTRKWLRIILARSQDQVRVSMTTQTSCHECSQRTQRMESMNRWVSVNRTVARFCTRARAWRWLERLLHLGRRRRLEAPEAVDLPSWAAWQVRGTILNSSETRKPIR